MGAFFKHPTALVETESVGEGTRIWAFAHVLKGATIGARCNIGDHCYIEGGVRIGDDVTIKNGISVWDGVVIEDGAFLGPNVTLTNDLRPRSRAKDWELVRTTVGRGASIGANATILAGIAIGPYAMVGAGAVVTRSVPAHGLVYGNPARLRGQVCRCGQRLEAGAGRVGCPRCGAEYASQKEELIYCGPGAAAEP